MLKLVLLIASVGWVLPACGDGSDDVAPTTTTVSTTTTAVVPTTTTARDATTTTTPAGGTTTAPVTLQCASVGFTPTSEDVASDVTATGLSCEEAESFVRVAGEQTSSGGPEEVDVSGYQCILTRASRTRCPRLPTGA